MTTFFSEMKVEMIEWNSYRGTGVPPARHFGSYFRKDYRSNTAPSTSRIRIFNMILCKNFIQSFWVLSHTKLPYTLSPDHVSHFSQQNSVEVKKLPNKLKCQKKPKQSSKTKRVLTLNTCEEPSKKFRRIFYGFFWHFNSSGSFLAYTKLFWGVWKTTFLLEWTWRVVVQGVPKVISYK